MAMQVLGADTHQAGIDMRSQDLLPEHVVQSLASGDVIFRRGRDVVSRLVLTADGHSDFSHVGVIVRDRWQINVAHAIPAESKNELDAVKMESLDSFLRHEKASVAAVYRVREHESIRASVIRYVTEAVRNQVLFDADFDLGDSSRLYCTELVWQAYRSAGLDLLDGKFDYISVPLKSGWYIFPSSLTHSRHLLEIYTSRRPTS